MFEMERITGLYKILNKNFWNWQLFLPKTSETTYHKLKVSNADKYI